MSHDFHSPRNRGVDAIKRHAGHRTQHHTNGRGHLWIQAEPRPEKPDGNDDHGREEDALPDRHQCRETKEGPASSAIARSFGSRDEGHDRVVEGEEARFAQEIRGRPSDRKSAECGWPEQARDQKCKNAAEIRREHRHHVDQRAAFQL